jgi:PHD/YefM family antitoxin component YafN of YafNO toxin-antitoxin module
VVHTIPLTKARTNLGALIKTVYRNKEYIILEKDGIPVAGLMNIDEFEDYLELHDPATKKHIAKSTAGFLAGKSRPLDTFLATLRPKNSRKSNRL